MLPITSPKTLGKVLRNYRKRAGLSQTAAGEKLNLPQKTISNIESGQPGTQVSSIFKYMTALGLEMELHARTRDIDKGTLW